MDLGAAPDAGLLLRLGGGRYALPLRSVLEVIRAPQVTRLPGLPGWLPGAVNWRGRVLAVVDLRGPLGVAPAAARRARLLVLGTEVATVGVLAESVDGICPPPATLTPPPPGPAAGLLAGTAVDAAGPLGWLEPDAVVSLRRLLPQAAG